MAVELDRFLAASATLTGYSPFRLRGTGLAEQYLATAVDAAGEAVVDDLLSGVAAAEQLAAEEEQTDLARALRHAVLSDPRLGPVARNLIKLWYVGTWYQLPQDWRDAHGAGVPDSTHVVSPAAYTEGLLWPTIDANPPGANPPGFGTWAAKPRLPLA